MPSYIYTPFPNDPELRLVIDKWVARREKYYKINQSLEEVPYSEVIYVVGHGSKDDNFIYSSPAISEKMSPFQLALRLVDDGLKPEHMNIKVFVCYSGQRINEEDGLAYKLWQQLKSHYKQLTVYGYTTMVRAPIPFEEGEEAPVNEQRLMSKLALPEGVNKTPLPFTAKHYRVQVNPDESVGVSQFAARHAERMKKIAERTKKTNAASTSSGNQ